MKKKLTIYTLEGCSFCERLRNELTHNYIQFNEVNCSGESSECTKLENITNCVLFPMMILESYPDKKIILCLANESSQLNSIKNINSKIILTHVHSIDNMVNVAKNI
jgi:glutaredoxin